MAIPISVNQLIDGNVVEYARVEYKSGWNPEDIIHSICAFANDIDNWGGGYIVIGVEDCDGLPVKPVKGVSPSSLDLLQKELVNLCNRLNPNYMPVCEPVEYEGAVLLIIWVPGGYDRPYRAPVSLSAKRSDHAVYIRRFSKTVKAKVTEERDLVEMGGRVPFDDRINNQAEVSDLRLGRMQDYLNAVGSSLARGASAAGLLSVARDLRVVGGPSEALRPINVGLMLFSDDPERFFPYTRIEVVEIPDPAGQGMREHTFRGPIDRQLSDALAYLRGGVCEERVFKVPGQAEAVRLWNYPYEALEEALGNAIYHRSYIEHEPVTLRVEADRLSITSCPGPDRSITDEDLAANRLVAQRYRNRRIGDFLKELHLIEGRNTGVPTMLRALSDNGSKPPLFETDDDRTFFKVTFFLHEAFSKELGSRGRISEQGPAQSRRTRAELRAVVIEELGRDKASQRELARRLGYRSLSKALREVVSELVDEGVIEYTGTVGGAGTKLRLRG